MHRYIIFFIIVNAVRVSGSFSTHHQELENCTHSIGYVPSLLLPLAWVSSNSPTLAVAASKQASLAHTRYCVYSFRALDDGRKNRPKHYSIVDNKEYCITLHLVGYTCVPWINETLQKIIECALALKRHVAFLAIFRQILSKLSFNCNHKCRF